jgi:hypothetical protein
MIHMKKRKNQSIDHNTWPEPNSAASSNVLPFFLSVGALWGTEQETSCRQAGRISTERVDIHYDARCKNHHPQL